jgi:hypothetical protein
MAQETRLTSYGEYGEQSIGAVDLDEIGPQHRSYRISPSMAARDPDDPIPLFLSAETDISRPPGTGKTWDGAAISTRILKASILAAAAAAIVFAFLSVDNPLALFANAKASLASPYTGQPSAASLPAVRSVAVVSVPPSNVASKPTRDEIAAALRAAHQGHAEVVRQPQAAAAPARRLDADDLATLLKRAKSLIAIGDIAAARLLLERAADAQEANAALLLAQTYDPAVLGTPDARSITPDPATARGWYQKAARFGSLEAQQRLAQMQN